MKSSLFDGECSIKFGRAISEMSIDKQTDRQRDKKFKNAFFGFIKVRIILKA